MTISKTIAILFGGVLLAQSASAASQAGPYAEGLSLYQAGRFSEATESFERAVKKKDNEKDARSYIERIRKETVERIRNKALTGVSKANWQSKFYFMNAEESRVRVGISAQELFERESVNFRPGAIEALSQIADVLQKSEANRVDVELVNELNQEMRQDPQTTARQLTAVYSYLALATRDLLPKYNQ
jgi:flagellar motor protein MotB